MAKRRPTPPKAKDICKPHGSQLVDVTSRRLQAARALWAEGRFNDAITLYEDAIRQEPNNVRAYVLTARAYAEKFDFERMERTHEKLIRRAPAHPGVHHYLGETFGQLKLPQQAIASYERAAGLLGAGPPTWMELASWYERGHRLDEAEELIERTMRAGFDLPLVWLVRGRIQRRQNRLAEAESTFRALIHRLPDDSEWTCQAWGELALMRDRAGDFDGAVEAIEHCKRPQRARAGPLRQAAEDVEVQMRELIAAVNRECFQRWRQEAPECSQHRVALLTGFPRSGTTLLEQVLDAHPELVSSEERDFLGRELFQAITSGRGKTPLLDQLNGLGTGEIERYRERYFRAMEYLLGEPIGDRVHLDKNPAYNLMIPLMVRLFPQSRLIVALRDPRDVVLSCYLRYLPLNAVSVCFLDFRATADRYALDMTAWLRFRELVDVPWCAVRYEDAVADLEGQARRALETLGLPWRPEVLRYRERMSIAKQITSPTYEAVAQPLYTHAIGRWKNYERLLAPALKTLEPFVRAFGYG